MPAAAWIGLALALLLLLAMRSSRRENFQTVDSGVQDEGAVTRRNLLDDELAAVIDRDVPDGADAVGLRTVTVEALESTARVNELLERINSYTSYNFMLINISNAKLQVDAAGQSYLSVLFMAHDAKRFFTRQIGANLTVVDGVMYVHDVGFINSKEDTSDLVGALDVQSQMTYAKYPDPFSDEW